MRPGKITITSSLSSKTGERGLANYDNYRRRSEYKEYDEGTPLLPRWKHDVFYACSTPSPEGPGLPSTICTRSGAKWGKGSRATIVKDVGYRPSVDPSPSRRTRQNLVGPDAVGGFGGKDLQCPGSGKRFRPDGDLGEEINTPGDEETFPYVRG